MPEITEAQQKRANNLIWNAAGNYAFHPDFKAYDEEGLADIYWNVIIGAARKYYDYPQFEELFKTLDEECQNMFWTALEKLIYPREREERPVLDLIRQVYESPLELHPDMTTEQIVLAARNFFRLYGQSGKEKKKRNLIGGRKPKTSSFHSFFPGMLLWHPANAYGSADGQDPLGELASKMSAEELRAFMHSKFGSPLFSSRKAAELEKALCNGNHSGCHLLFTDGDRPEISKIQNGFEALSRQREAEQVILNRNFYQMRLHENRTAIAKLAENIQNSVLMHLQPTPVKSETGRLNGTLAWRAAVLNENRVFTRNEQDNPGDLCVDLLLDASTSQTNRLETISSQAYIIAEALRRCSIPCRVISFCSMTGYTVLRVFKKNEDIFEFVSNGCNRDGLGIRAAAELIGMENCEHRMLIVLSDVKPNDVVRIRPDDDSEPVAYEKKAGLYDTAYEVRRARAEGISVICIFTGEDEDLPAAAMVYGHDFVRIKSFGMLADTVGKLIKNQIKNM